MGPRAGDRLAALAGAGGRGAGVGERRRWETEIHGVISNLPVAGFQGPPGVRSQRM